MGERWWLPRRRSSSHLQSYADKSWMRTGGSCAFAGNKSGREPSGPLASSFTVHGLFERDVVMNVEAFANIGLACTAWQRTAIWAFGISRCSAKVGE